RRQKMLTTLTSYVHTTELAPPLPEKDALSLAAELSDLGGLQVYPRSLVATQRTLFFLGRREGEKYLGVLSHGASDSAVRRNFVGQTKAVTADGTEMTLTLCETNAANAAALRQSLPFLTPRPLGLRKSAGCGDRLGLATPGHVRALRRSTLAPILP